DADLHHDFPQRHHTDQNIVRGIRNHLPCRTSKLVIVGQPPKQGMGVEEELHPSSPSMAASTSAGGPSKNSASPILPRSAPGRRGGRSACRGGPTSAST